MIGFTQSIHTRLGPGIAMRLAIPSNRIDETHAMIPIDETRATTAAGVHVVRASVRPKPSPHLRLEGRGLVLRR